MENTDTHAEDMPSFPAASTSSHPSPSTPLLIYFAGGPNTQTISPPIHNHIAASLSLPWTCSIISSTSIPTILTRFRDLTFAGGIITMPYKRTIIPYLDSVDDHVRDIGACNHVRRDREGRLHGGNTDWVGVSGALMDADVEGKRREEEVGAEVASTALVYGAGGAARAAIYALASMECRRIYIINRDETEVTALIANVENYRTIPPPQLIHIKNIEQATQLSISTQCPRSIVCTVPNSMPQTQEERACWELLNWVLDLEGEKGTLLDMCYHPVETRNITLAREKGWRVVMGYMVVCHQFSAQWGAWTGKDVEKEVDMEMIFGMCEKLVWERGRTHERRGDGGEVVG